MVDLRRQLPQSGRPLSAVLSLAAVLGVVWLLGNAIAAEAARGVILLVAVIAAVIVAAKTVNDWRGGIYFFLTWLVCEDLVRKYMGNNMYVYFAKDVLAAIMYVSFLTDRSRGKALGFRSPFLRAFGFFFLLCLAQIANPNSPSILYGLLGLKLYFYYVPMVFLGYALIRSQRELSRFLAFNVALAALVALVGIIQALGWKNFLNPQTLAPELETLGHLTRTSPLTGLEVPVPPSVFVSAGRFDSYLVLAFILALGAASYELVRPQRRGKFIFPALGIVGAAGLLSGSRSALVYPVASALVLVGAMALQARHLHLQRQLLKGIRWSFAALCLSIVAVFFVFPRAGGASWSYSYETLYSEGSEYRSDLLYRAWDYPMGFLSMALDSPNWATGSGTGTGSLGVQYVSKLVGIPYQGWIHENGFATLIEELGVLGPILWVIWSAVLVFSAWRVVARLRGAEVFPVALAILWFAWLVLFWYTWGGIQGYQNFINNAYLWLLLGVLFGLPRLTGQGPSTGVPAADSR